MPLNSSILRTCQNQFIMDIHIISYHIISFHIISSFKTGPQAKHVRLPSLGEKLTKLIIQVVFVSLLYFPFRFEVSQSFSSKCYLGQKESFERMYLLNVYCYGYGYHLKFARIVHIPPIPPILSHSTWPKGPLVWAIWFSWSLRFALGWSLPRHRWHVALAHFHVCPRLGEGSCCHREYLGDFRT